MLSKVIFLNAIMEGVYCLKVNVQNQLDLNSELTILSWNLV